MEMERKQQTAKGPTDWFTGEVWLDPIVQPREPSQFNVAAVHFTPGPAPPGTPTTAARPCIATEGEGRVQSRREQLVKLPPGDVAYTPSGEWHWHGAASEPRVRGCPDTVRPHFIATPSRQAKSTVCGCGRHNREDAFRTSPRCIA